MYCLNSPIVEANPVLYHFFEKRAKKGTLGTSRGDLGHGTERLETIFYIHVEVSIRNKKGLIN